MNTLLALVQRELAKRRRGEDKRKAADLSDDALSQIVLRDPRARAWLGPGRSVRDMSDEMLAAIASGASDDGVSSGRAARVADEESMTIAGPSGKEEPAAPIVDDPVTMRLNEVLARVPIACKEAPADSGIAAGVSKALTPAGPRLPHFW
jgi:hypothetical protein